MPSGEFMANPQSVNTSNPRRNTASPCGGSGNHHAATWPPGRIMRPIAGQDGSRPLGLWRNGPEDFTGRTRALSSSGTGGTETGRPSYLKRVGCDLEKPVEFVVHPRIAAGSATAGRFL